MESHLLTIKDLVIEADVGGTWQSIVKGLSLSLAQGEVVGLIGESGAGKSTLGLAALGYTKPGCRIRSGSIVLGGQELVDCPNQNYASYAVYKCLTWPKVRPPRLIQPIP